MCPCLSFLAHPAVTQTCYECRRALLRLLANIQSCQLQFASVEVNLFSYAETQNEILAGGPDSLASFRAYRRARKRLKISSLKIKGEKANDSASSIPKTLNFRNKEPKKLVEAQTDDDMLFKTPKKVHRANGSSNVASLYTREGRKGVNQDAMIVWEDFGALEDTIFCGVFDGHGSNGHLVAQNVRDCLPAKLLSSFKAKGKAAIVTSREGTSNTDNSLKELGIFSSWKESLLAAYKVMDKELLVEPFMDCFSSGTTAVTIVKQGRNLIIGNVGDSRAVLGTKLDDNSMVAVQLTVDLKPNLPQEAERIKKCRGRVFALHDEPQVQRVWLPYSNSPGLAMARAFGDFCLKSFGVIAVPEVAYRRLTDKDQFIVLATDGVWDVLSNEQVVEIISSVPARKLAARAVVDMAVRAWKIKYPTSKVDDCAVVCLYVGNVPINPAEIAAKQLNDLPASKRQNFQATCKVSSGKMENYSVLREGKTERTLLEESLASVLAK